MRRPALALALVALATAHVAAAGPLMAVDLGGEYMKVKRGEDGGGGGRGGFPPSPPPLPIARANRRPREPSAAPD